MPLLVVPRRDRSLHRHIKAAAPRTLHRGETLYGPGEASQEVVLVREGHLCLTAEGGGGAAAGGGSGDRPGGQVLAILGPMEMGGEELLGKGGVTGYGARAGEACTVQMLDARKVARVIASSPVTRAAFLEALTGDLALARLLARRSPTLPTAERLAAVLVDLFARLGHDVDGGMILPVKVTHRTLGDLAAAHRSTTTTVLNDWLYRGDLDLVERSLFLPVGSRLARFGEAASR